MVAQVYSRQYPDMKSVAVVQNLATLRGRGGPRQRLELQHKVKKLS